MTRGWQTIVGAAVLWGACTRPNAAYEGGVASETGVESGEGTTLVADASAEDGPEPTTAVLDGSSGAVDTSGTSDTNGLPECVFPMPFDVALGDAMELLPCGGVTTFGIYPPKEIPMGVPFVADLCLGGCGCAGMEWSGVEVTIQGPVPPLSPLPECIALDVEPVMGPTGCDVLAYAFHDGEGVVTVAANELFTEVAPALSVEIGEEPVSRCDGECLPPSGHYPLLWGETSIDPGQEAMVTVGPSTYRLFNRGSGYDGQCEKVVRWTAQRQ